MKREYTLLTIGLLTMILEWVGLTPSLRKIVFTLIGLWLIVIAFRYRSQKISGKLQINKLVKADEPAQIPEPELTSSLSENINYEPKQHIKPRI